MKILKYYAVFYKCMNESADEECDPLTREDLEDSGVDVSITNIFKKPVTRITLESPDGEVEKATILGESQDDPEDLSVKWDLEVSNLEDGETMFFEIEFLDDEEKYYLELDDETIWNIYQHFGSLRKEDLLDQTFVLDHVGEDSIVLNRSQYKELYEDKPSIPDQDQLDLDMTLKDYEEPVENYGEIVHDVALTENTPFSVIVEDVQETDDFSVIVVRHGELLYEFEYTCDSEIQDCNPTFKRLVNDIANGESSALKGSTLQIKHREDLGEEQPIYGELDKEYVLTRPLTNQSILNTVSSLLSKGKGIYRNNLSRSNDSS